MIVEVTNVRTSQFAIGDRLGALPKNDYYGEFDTFRQHEPFTVLEVIVEKRSFPYTFKYFCENNIGERMFVEEQKLFLFTPSGEECVSVDEKYVAVSSYEVNDNYRFPNGDKGVVVKVVTEYDKNHIPHFLYLIERPDRTRKRVS